jgi:hypothetical protein
VGRFTLKNVCEKKGLIFFRRKVAGRDTYIRLPPIDHPDFLTEYQMLSRGEPLRTKAAPGTFAALVEAFRASPEWAAKDIKTRTNQSRYLDMIVAEHGHRTVAGVRPVHVYTCATPSRRRRARPTTG